MRSSIYLAVPVMALLGIVQTAVLPRFLILGLSPQLPLLVALAWGLLRGFDEGVLWAFVAGFFTDLFSISPMGLTALTYMAAVAAVLWIQSALPTSRVFLPLLLAGLATLGHLALYLTFLRLLGFGPTLQTAAALPPLAVINAGAMLPLYWLMFALLQVVRPRRVQL